jgi:hypothetical protein
VEIAWPNKTPRYFGKFHSQAEAEKWIANHHWLTERDQEPDEGEEQPSAPLSMPTFLYRCPNTGLKVQGWVADDPARDETFEPVTCTACARVHLVNPKTGKVGGTEK